MWCCGRVDGREGSGRRSRHSSTCVLSQRCRSVILLPCERRVRFAPHVQDSLESESLRRHPSRRASRAIACYTHAMVDGGMVIETRPPRLY